MGGIKRGTETRPVTAGGAADSYGAAKSLKLLQLLCVLYKRLQASSSVRVDRSDRTQVSSCVTSADRQSKSYFYAGYNNVSSHVVCGKYRYFITTGWAKKIGTIFSVRLNFTKY